MKTTTLAFASIMMLSTYSETGGDNFRPYISTNLAKIVMTGDNEVTEECDGSGWITHGDGHKTECVGCSACSKGDLTSSQEKPECKTETYKECETTRYKTRKFRPLRSLLGILK
tara:strand:+ start:515 stop:856 length:342 start_codon:yes stop_codon:yes gene_type:complete